MTTHALHGREVLLVEVEQEAKRLTLSQCYIHTNLEYCSYTRYIKTRLPPGNYSLPSPTTVSGMSEEVAKGLVEEPDTMMSNGNQVKYWGDYLSEHDLSIVYTALESLCSFIKSKSLDPDRVVVVIKEK